MKIEQEVNNQWRIIRKISNNKNGTFNWDDLRTAIESLLDMERIRIDPDYFDNH